MGRIKLKSLIKLTALLVLVYALYAFLTSYATDYVKKDLPMQLRELTGASLTFGNIKVTLIPLHIDLQDVKLNDPRGAQVASVNRLLVYVSLLPLVKNRVVVDKIHLDGLKVDASLDTLNSIARGLTDGGKQKDKPRPKAGKTKEGKLVFAIKTIKLNDIDVKIVKDSKKYELALAGFTGSFTPKHEGELDAKFTNVVLYADDLSDIIKEKIAIDAITVKASGVLSEAGNLKLSEFTLKNNGLKVNVNGTIQNGFKSVNVTSDLSADMQYVKELMGLKRDGLGQVSAKGTITYDGKDVRVDQNLQGRVLLETFLELVGETREPLHGDILFKGKVEGPVTDFKGALDTYIQSSGFYGIDVNRMTTAVTYEDFKMHFKTEDAELYGGSAMADVTINLPVVTHFTMDVKASNVDSAPLFKLIEWDPGLAPGKVWATLHSDGRVFNPDGSFTYKSSVAGNDNKDSILKRITAVDGNVRIQHELITLDGINVKSDRSSATINGTYNTEKEALKLQATVHTTSIAEITRPSTAQLDGRGKITATIEGNSDNPLITAKVAIDEGSIMGIRFSSLNTDVKYMREFFELNNGTARAYGGAIKLTGKGSFKDTQYVFDFNHPDASFDVSAGGIDVGKLQAQYLNVLPLGGTAAGSLSLHAGADSVSFKGKSNVSALTVYSTRVGELTGSVSFVDRVLKLEGVSLKRNKTQISATGYADLKPQGRLEIKTNVCHVDSAQIPGAHYLGGSVIDCSLNASGPVANVQAELSATLSGEPTLASNVTLKVAGDKVSATGTLLSSKVTLAGSGKVQKGFPWELRASFSDSDYGPVVRRYIKNAPDDLFLVLAGDVSITGGASGFSGILASVNFPKLSAQAYDHKFANVRPVSISVENNKVTINSLELTSNSAGVKAYGEVVPGQSYNLVIEGSPKLALLKGAFEKISIISGEADMGFLITGSWNSPEILGGMNIEGASLGLKNYKYFFNDINASMYVDKNKIVFTAIDSSVGAGSLNSKAVVYLDGFKLKDFFFESIIRNLPVAPIDDFLANVDGELYYRGTRKQQRLSGEIRVNQARYTKNFYLQDLIFDGLRVNSKAKGTVSETALNLAIKGDKNISIENNVTDAFVAVNLDVRGTMSRPLIYGRVETSNGKIYMRNTEFTLLHASADFAGSEEFNPFVNVLAETTLKAYNVKFMMDGYLKKFGFTLTSTPQLDEPALMKLVSEAGAGSLLSNRYQGSLEERIRSFGGFSRVDLAPAISTDKSTITPQVTISKKFLSDKLKVSLTSGTTKGEILKGEYSVNKNMSVVGERDEYGNFGSDIKFKYRFK